ncbi:MAG: hypothetical protein QOH03_4336 [Kribbellaceae bacterium]|jgi:regulator of protease activity HflC (stomatin/prohibitin superfamily)|nr:hypothetical protein [Kribbellaceae bacterium]
MPIQSQGIITRDNVSVDVSAVAYYRVVDAVNVGPRGRRGFGGGSAMGTGWATRQAARETNCDARRE